jgi:hypothetical protein
MRHILLAVLLVPFSAAWAQDPAARDILERFSQAKPPKDKLAFYCLDWAATLEQAKIRAAKENRPIVFFWITNISAGCNFFSGHT